MGFWKKEKKDNKQELPVIDVSIDEVRQAIRTSAGSLPMEISLRSLVNPDHSIDFQLLGSILKGIPRKTFYMSKETFEVFEDQAPAIAVDQVQAAVDNYYKETGEWPVIAGTSKISYFLIKHYLKTAPDMELYLDPKDKMVTHRRPISK